MFAYIVNILKDIFFLEEEKKEYIEIYEDKTDHYKKEFKEFSLDKAIVALKYNKSLQKDLKKFKYRYNDSSIKDFIGFYRNIFIKYLFKEDKEDIIITGTPIFYLNRLFRGYDHTHKLGGRLGKELGLEYKKLLIKTKYTKRQSTLNKKERLINITNCYDINHKYEDLISNKTIILLDDVISTGKTANEACLILKKYKAKKVIGIFLASSN